MNKYYAAIAVLENYLDGALADMQDGKVDNKEFIESCVEAHKLLTENYLCDTYEKKFRELANKNLEIEI